MNTFQSIASHRLLVPDRPLAEQAQRLAAAGFDACELPVSEQGVLTPQTEQLACAAMLETFRSAGLRVAALHADFGRVHLMSRSDQARKDAQRRIAAALRRAEWLGATVVSTAGFRDSPADNTAQNRHTEVLASAARSLARLAAEAESLGVRIAVAAPSARALLTPIETAELIDRVNSPWIGVCLDLTDPATTSPPAEWVDELGWRLAAVRADNGTADSADASIEPIADAIERISFGGPLFVSSPLAADSTAPQ